jgi:hypothetical protein
MRAKFSFVALTAGLLFAGCESSADRVLAIDAEGRVGGIIYVDRNASGSFEPAVDAPAPGVAIALIVPGSTPAVAQVTTDANGVYVFSNVPVGRYSLRVDTSNFGDSLRVARIDSLSFTVAASDTPTVSVSLTYPPINVADVRTLPAGKRVLLQGVALNGWTAFADSTLHIADSTGVLRVLRVAPAPIVAGDTVRLLGTVTLQGGVPTVADVVAFRVGPGPLIRTPKPLTTAAAATANGGLLDADLVLVSNAMIINAFTSPTGRVTATVDDGSGTLEVVLEPTGNFGNRPAMAPGSILQVTGLLVPNSTRTAWQLKPRATADLTVTFRKVTIAEARTLEVGRLVEIEGLALNGWQTFFDASVHVVDATGSLRTTAVRPVNLFAGDSVRFLGTIVMRDGQPILTQVEPTVLATGRVLPNPRTLTTAAAATADGGVADAALVRISNATIKAVGSSGGDFRMDVDDGSGIVVVIIDRDLGLVTTPYVVNAKVNVTGLLVPTPGGGSWRLHPRSQADIAVVP